MTTGWYTARDIAAKLQRPVAWFRKNRAGLEAHGFPRPDARIPGKYPRWVAAQVDAWINPVRSGVSGGPVTIDFAATLDANSAKLRDRGRGQGRRVQ